MADDDPFQLDPADALTRQIDLDTVFQPSAPIDRNDLFFGRGPQQWSLGEAVRSRGQHAIIYGARGVGKTSLASVFAAQVASDGHLAVIVTCDIGDNFASIWQKFIDECGIWLVDHPDAGEALVASIEKAAEILDRDAVGPSHVRVALRHITSTPGLGQVIIFFDEIDQLHSPESVELLANTIKALSDKIEPVTIIPVGVATSVDQLISGHLSIRRNLVQVEMPRLGRDELHKIAHRGFEQLQMTIDADASAFIEIVPRGLPHYAHLLAQEGARQALMAARTNITMAHMIEGLRVGLEKVDHTLSHAYDEATYSPQQSSRFGEVLLACALAEPDEHGYFSPSDLRDPYTRVTGKQQEIPNYNPQLTQLSEEGRGEILTRAGAPYRWRYRFSDPLMEPFVLLKGIEAKLITPDELLGKVPATERGQLF